jgi:hypothetical protein
MEFLQPILAFIALLIIWSRELGFYCYVAWLASYDLPICRAYIRCSVRQHESVGDIERRKTKIFL